MTISLTPRSILTVFFVIDGKIYKQRDGSAIGVDLSVETASIYMTLWDSKFRERLRKLGFQLPLYCRYVDDILLALGGLNPGWYYCTRSRRMAFNLEHETATLEADHRTLEALKAIANELDSDIQFTIDCPSLNFQS